MKLNNRITKKWWDMRHKGDAAIIAKKAGVSQITVYRAYGGSASPELAKIMTDFYNEREQFIIGKPINQP